ncbi:TetR/AcrR family transcriptional regulator [Clostridium sp. KNHs205]|uniref:TetR/AcrR family transcriptional regulator n=1 Tax=Clostridium sp. KNHs205 TaxID=1449050 RepID=UPI00051B312D|nr:TetR/AcrR family transcriptional regulator [Clostridium sp. KNHs205]
MSDKITRDIIIETANQLFLKNGYKNVTVLDICNACDISKTAFYYHLKSKEDAILNFHDAVTKNITKHLISILSKDNYWDQLLICFESLIKEASKFGTDFMSQMLTCNLKVDYGSYDFREELTNVVVMIIKKGQEAGQFRNRNDALTLFRAASYMFLGQEVTWCIKKGEFMWLDEIRHGLECIFDVSPELR